jgi:hypothetical protein
MGTDLIEVATAYDALAAAASELASAVGGEDRASDAQRAGQRAAGIAPSGAVC